MAWFLMYIGMSKAMRMCCYLCYVFLILSEKAKTRFGIKVRKVILFVGSVTAEKWVPIIEVPVSNVKGFLEKKKGEGFSILGLEQTANSLSLDQYLFPTKTVNNHPTPLVYFCSFHYYFSSLCLFVQMYVII